MVDEEEGRKIGLEAQEITRELCTVFEGHLTELINQGNIEKVAGDIALKTLVCKANRRNPNYPNPKHQPKEITEALYRGYGSDSGVLFGIPAECKQAVETVVKLTIDKVLEQGA